MLTTATATEEALELLSPKSRWSSVVSRRIDGGITATDAAIPGADPTQTEALLLTLEGALGAIRTVSGVVTVYRI